MSKPFNNKEIEILKRKKAAGLTYKQIMKFLPGRSLGVIKQKARSFGLVKKRPRIKKYTEQDERFIEECVLNNWSYSKIAKDLGRSEEAIKQKVFKMGLSEEASASWVLEEDDLLKEMITEGHQMSDILHLFEGRTIFSLRWRSHFLGLDARESQKEKRRRVTRKICKTCGIEKDVSEFYYDSRTNLPISDCKPCRYSKSREWVLQNPEKSKQTRAKWLEANASLMKQYYHDYHLENIERRKRLGLVYRSKEENKLMARLRSKEYYKNNKEKVRKYFNEVWKPNNYDKLLEQKRWYYQENRERIRNQQAELKRKIQNLKTENLIKFYLENDVPEYLWHRQEFALEEDFQSALAHVLINKYKINAELEVVLYEFGRPDIYLPEYELLLEIKLTSFKWTKKQIVEQVAKYNEISETWVVCLDNAPQWALEMNIPWFTPELLFDFFDDFTLNI